jgi:uncharacterized membrane protein YvbJ
MKCRQCGSEIADKALVCYRCGTATTESKYKAPVGKKPSSMTLVVTVLTVILVVLFGFYVQRTSAGGASAELRWLVVAVAAAIVAIRVAVRRRRR